MDNDAEGKCLVGVVWGSGMELSVHVYEGASEHARRRSDPEDRSMTT